MFVPNAVKPCFEHILQYHLPEITICDLNSKMFSCVTKKKMEAGRPHPWALCSWPSGLISSGVKRDIASLLFRCWFFVTRVISIVYFTAYIHSHLMCSPFHRAGKDYEEPVHIADFVAFDLWSGLVSEWLQDSAILNLKSSISSNSANSIRKILNVQKRETSGKKLKFKNMLIK